MQFSLFIILLGLFFSGCQSMHKNANGSSKANSQSNSNANSQLNPKTERMIKNAKNAKAANAAKNIPSQQSIYEQLTGNKTITADAINSRKILEMARDSRFRKDYATALKRYNTLIVRFPKSMDVKTAYMDKSEMYREMGLIDQANYNMQLAKQFGVKVQARTAAKVQVKVQAKDQSVNKGTKAIR